MRSCRIMIAQNCIKVFRSKTRRPIACKHCKELLKKLGKNAWSWLHMNKEPVEKVEWKDRDHAVVTIEKENEVTHVAGKKKKVVGTVKEVAKFDTSAVELNEGIDLLKKSVEQTQTQINAQQSSLIAMGDIPSKTNEVIRLEKNMVILGTNQKAQQLKDKMKELGDTLELQQTQLKAREEMMVLRPKA